MKLIKMHPLIVDSITFESHFFDYDEEMRKIKQFSSLDQGTLCDLRVRYGMKHFPLRKLMENPQLLSFEKTPAYILEESIPAKIKAITPWYVYYPLSHTHRIMVQRHTLLTFSFANRAKVIFSLRNPIGEDSVKTIRSSPFTR